jgi:hypothetical protein
MAGGAPSPSIFHSSSLPVFTVIILSASEQVLGHFFDPYLSQETVLKT